ncbi:MAG: bifunctional GNAT family N-acetyltransferase/acetate--CoA ligase family protein [Actinomycetota bacterium]|nr:bifunctional GNAT family N-acetyltransferase/acetate--CoA ligase family protein [Actinomycetota bacterium]
MADYPYEYELDVVLRDGGVARIRPIKPNDASQAKAFFERLGPESRYFRFFRIKATLTDEEIAHFTQVDYADRMAFVALLDGEAIGVGRYDRVSPGADTAEVAFAVVDDHQGRGIGTQILQLLTKHARESGVEHFRAYVLGENRQMMRVFRNSGYELTRTVDDGVFTVDFPILESEDSLAAAAEREKRAVAASLLPLFFPRSVAVIGASNNGDSIGGKLFNNLMGEGFTGPLYPVNPTSKVVHSVKAYPTILDVPDVVDLAYIVVPGRFVLDVARQCAEKGVRGIVVISAGFSEVGGDGEERERQLLEIVRSSGMRMIGPNCMGLLNTVSSVRLNGTFGPVYPPAGNVAMSSQSGALGIAILDYATRNNIGISQFVSVGNKADVSANDLILAWEDDPETDVITLYVESFGNPRKFSRIARRISRTKPIIAVKSGRTEAGSRAASSHTGALASSDTAVRALFTQAGVIRVDTIEELFDAASLLASQPIPSGTRVGVVTNAGGPGILAADALEDHGMILPELSDALQARIAEMLPTEASTRNPVDLIASGGPAEFAHATREILDSGEVDSLIVIYVPTSPEGGNNVAAVLRQCQDAYEGKVTFLSVFMDAGGGAGAALAGEGGARSIPTYLFPEAAALALARAVRYGKWRQRDPGVEARLDEDAEETIRPIVERVLERLGSDGGWLDPEEVDACLRAAGLWTPETAVVTGRDAAVETAREFGGPVVLKVISESALHKSDVGGVVLDAEGDVEVGEGYDQVMSAVSDPDGVLIQEFVPGGHEVLIGMAQDPNFGPLVGFGLGGIYVELLRDVSLRIHPITDVDASEMVRETKAFRLLEGYRGQPAGDVVALEDALQRISGLISAMPELVEMDLNPVKVLQPGQGVCVVDARMRVEAVPPGQMPTMKDLPGVT